MCNLRSTVPLRMGCKPPSRPSLLTPIHEVEKSAPPESPFRTPPPCPLPLPLRSVNQTPIRGFATVLRNSVAQTNPDNEMWDSPAPEETRENVVVYEKLPFNGVPPLLAVLRTQVQKK